MLKKILLWTLFAGFTGLLIFGAINRTTAKIENDDGLQAGHVTEQGNTGNLDNGQNGNGYGQGKVSPSQLGQPVEDEDAAISQSDETSPSEEAELTDHETEEHDWAVVEGTISTLTSREMVVETSDGQQVLVSRRPWRFALEHGFSALTGDQVELDGFYKEGEYEVAAITNLTTGQIVRLRDEAGHPLWASGGDY